MKFYAHTDFKKLEGTLDVAHVNWYFYSFVPFIVRLQISLIFMHCFFCSCFLGTDWRREEVCWHKDEATDWDTGNETQGLSMQWVEWYSVQLCQSHYYGSQEVSASPGNVNALWGARRVVGNIWCIAAGEPPAP